MEASYLWLNSLVSKNKSEFASWVGIKWLNPYISEEYQKQRLDLLQNNNTPTLFKGTKPYHFQLSRGCEICGAGKWSCLFVTGMCNGGCFYCPSPQLKDETPSTQGLEFENPDDYVTYLNFFDFKGVAFSGGEPLLFHERTLKYLKAVRKRCKNDIYTWMYTNGLLAGKKELFALADGGLDEIRFDIGATGFKLHKVKQAKGIIPKVTIEIPAIPEEKERLLKMLPEMIKLGVTNLNLHQLRLTPHNANHLINKGYTIINAEKPLVLESELTALEIIDRASQKNLEIGINYCSFHYKNRFQKAGYRIMLVKKLMPGACITENGFIREYSGDSLKYKTIKLSNPKIPASQEMDRPYSFTVKTLFQLPAIPNDYKKSIDELLNGDQDKIPDDHMLFKIWQYEWIERGLRNY